MKGMKKCPNKRMEVKWNDEVLEEVKTFKYPRDTIVVNEKVK